MAMAAAQRDVIAELRAKNKRLEAALTRINAVQLEEPPPITDPDWKARLMQSIARDALTDLIEH
jgi:hypothetical protein